VQVPRVRARSQTHSRASDIAWAAHDAAASGLKDFDLLLNDAIKRAPVGELVDIMDVGFTCAYLASSYAKRLTGSSAYVDGGMNIVA
jgi:enoyl-[acyl-carrier-protein] reductase (NADH)